jgi:hypothetical protein
MPISKLLKKLLKAPYLFACAIPVIIKVLVLKLANRYSKKSVVCPGGPVITLTTYGARFRTVYLTLESIARGSVRPSNLILWLDDAKLFQNLPAKIVRLQKRGLEVQLSAKNYGPHTKYYPYLESQNEFVAPLVTADDDILYPCHWLRGLVEGSLHYASFINCYRAHVVAVNATGIVPYLTWKPCRITAPLKCHFATGVSGVLYPPIFLQRLKEAGPGFEACCPKADDVWLHVQAIRAGFSVRQVVKKPVQFPVIPLTQRVALAQGNLNAGGNDRQIAATYGAEDIERILEDSI